MALEFPPLSAQAEKAIASLEFRELHGGIIVLSTRLGSQRNQSMIVDTGSSIGMLLDVAAAERAGLPRSAPLADLRMEGFLPDAAHPQDWRKARVIDGKVTLATGTYPTADLSLMSREIGEPIAGILGVPTLSKFVVELNYDSHRMFFYKPETYKPSADSVKLQLLPIKMNLLAFSAEICKPDGHSQSVRAYFDSGSDREMMLSERFFRSQKDITFSGDAIESANLGTASFRSTPVDILGARLGSIKLAISDALVSIGTSKKMLDGEVDVGFGAPILRQFNIVIDRPHGALYLSPRQGQHFVAGWPGARF